MGTGPPHGFQLSAGSYLYVYNPTTSKLLSDPNNVVRQAGCAVALSASAAKEADTRRSVVLQASAQRAIWWVINELVSRDPHISRIESDTAGDRGVGGDTLGAAALLLLAIQFVGLVSYSPYRRLLRSRVLSLQNQDGSFRCRLNSAVRLTFIARPGLLSWRGPSLALTYEEARGRSECGHAIGRSFCWYRNHFRKHPSTAFVPWHAETWQRASRHAGQQRLYSST